LDPQPNGALAHPNGTQEKRWTDRAVAKRLGIDLGLVRAKVATQRSRLEAYAPVVSDGDAFMLTREQARDIASQYDTQEASRIRRDNVRAFSRVDALEALFQETNRKLDVLDEILDEVKRKRRDPSATLVREFANFVRIEMRGVCPWCGKSPMFQGGENQEEFSDLVEVDHFDGNRQNNEDHNFWPLCKPCHKRKTNEKTREVVRLAFNAHQLFWDRFDTWRVAVRAPPAKPKTQTELYEARIEEIKRGPHWKP
jgi:5-methylcytosine-specific restriction endonuclease McrA